MKDTKNEEKLIEENHSNHLNSILIIDESESKEPVKSQSMNLTIEFSSEFLKKDIENIFNGINTNQKDAQEKIKKMQQIIKIYQETDIVLPELEDSFEIDFTEWKSKDVKSFKFSPLTYLKKNQKFIDYKKELMKKNRKLMTMDINTIDENILVDIFQKWVNNDKTFENEIQESIQNEVKYNFKNNFSWDLIPKWKKQRELLENYSNFSKNVKIIIDHLKFTINKEVQNSIYQKIEFKDVNDALENYNSILEVFGFMEFINKRSLEDERENFQLYDHIFELAFEKLNESESQTIEFHQIDPILNLLESKLFENEIQILKDLHKKSSQQTKVSFNWDLVPIWKKKKEFLEIIIDSSKMNQLLNEISLQ